MKKIVILVYAFYSCSLCAMQKADIAPSTAPSSPRMEPKVVDEGPFRCLLSPSVIWSQPIPDDEKKRLTDIESLDARTAHFSPLEWIKAFGGDQLSRKQTRSLLKALQKIASDKESLIAKSKNTKLSWLRKLIKKEKIRAESTALPTISRTPPSSPITITASTPEKTLTDSTIKTPPGSMVLEMATSLTIAEKSIASADLKTLYELGIKNLEHNVPGIGTPEKPFCVDALEKMIQCDGPFSFDIADKAIFRDYITSAALGKNPERVYNLRDPLMQIIKKYLAKIA